MENAANSAEVKLAADTWVSLEKKQEGFTFPSREDRCLGDKQGIKGLASQGKREDAFRGVAKVLRYQQAPLDR